MSLWDSLPFVGADRDSEREHTETNAMSDSCDKDGYEVRTGTITKTQLNADRREWVVEQYHRHKLVNPETDDQWICEEYPSVDDTPYRRFVFKADEVVDDPDETRIE